MASQSQLELIVSVIDQATAELRRIAAETGNVGEATEKVGEKSSLKWTELRSAIGLVTDALSKAQRTAQQLVEFGLLGAQAEQTEINFERLGERLSLTSDYLQRLREASSGTVDDLKLMQGVSVLTAGTTGELEAAMGAAYPTLLEYAKAAAALNPQLGDVDYMLSSIATGIKRGSPMILDNLGIVVKVEEANKAYAEALGKTVEELTAEERQMALLNGVMGAGKVLVDQVGGSTESLTDSFGRAKAATANYKTEISKAWHELLAASGAMDALADSMDAMTRARRVRAAIDELTDLGYATDEVRNKWEKLAHARGNFNADEEAEIALLAEVTEELSRYNDALGLQNDVLDEHAALIDRRITDINREETATRAGTAAIEAMEEADEWLIGVLKRHEQAARDAAGGTRELTAAEQEIIDKQARVTAALETTFDKAAAAIRESNIPLRNQIDMLNYLARASGDLTDEQMQVNAAIQYVTKSRELNLITDGQWMSMMDQIHAGTLTYTQLLEANAIPAMEDLGKKSEYATARARDLGGEMRNLPEMTTVGVNYNAIDEANERAAALLEKLRLLGEGNWQAHLNLDIVGEHGIYE